MAQIEKIGDSDLVFQSKLDSFAKRKIKESREVTVTAETGTLVGRMSKDVVAVLLGVDGMIPKTLTITPKVNLENAWNRKIKYSGLSDAAAHKLPLLINAFEKTTRNPMTIKDFEFNVESALNELKNNFDFDKYGKAMGLDEARIQKLKQFAKTVSAKHLIPYLITEMLPGGVVTSKGEVSARNIKILDFLLSTLGPEYIDMVPAQGDEYLSLGGYQFTSLSIKNDSDGTSGPISKASKYVTKPNLSLPGSVYLLRGADHHVAAYLLALHHFSVTLKKVESSRLVEVDNFLKNYIQVVGYLGACHNQSQSANDFARYINGKSGAQIEFVRKSDKLSKRVVEHYNKSVDNAIAYKVYGPLSYKTVTPVKNTKDLK